MSDVPTAVYRLIDAAGGLLYIGISLDLTTRFRAHRDQRADWRQVARIDLAWYDSRDEAASIETVAIETERPPWNVVGTPVSSRLARGTKAQHVVDHIVERVHGGNLAPGSRLPSTSALARQFGYNANTVRRGVGFLINRGFLRGHQGVGVFVAERTSPE